MLNLASTNEQKVPVTLSPKTASGQPAQLDGPPTVEVDAGSGVTVEQDPASPLLIKFVSGDNPETATGTISADADLGAGVVTISETFTYEVSGAQAANFGFTVGAPEPK